MLSLSWHHLVIPLIADTFKSVNDIEESGAEMTDTDIVLNIPVVPTGSTLQDPLLGGTNAAPIQPTMVFYRGTTVQTFVFEVKSEDAAMYFANTRSGDATSVSQGTTPTTGYEIPIVAFSTADFVSAIPLWHVNQFSNGVMEGMGGGPNPAGMRNVIVRYNISLLVLLLLVLFFVGDEKCCRLDCKS
jgi:hypothetical protein